jgi:hypothetical protein
MSIPGATDVNTAALASNSSPTRPARTSLTNAPAAVSSPGVETVVSSRSSRAGSRTSGAASAASGPTRSGVSAARGLGGIVPLERLTPGVGELLVDLQVERAARDVEDVADAARVDRVLA